MENVDGGGVAGPQVEIAVAQGKFAGGGFEVVEPSADFDHPAVVQPASNRSTVSPRTSDSTLESSFLT